MNEKDLIPQHFIYKGEMFKTTHMAEYFDPLNIWSKVTHLRTGLSTVYLHELDDPRDWAEEIYQFLENQKREEQKMTYGTYATIKQALESLNIRENIVISVVDGVVSIDDLQALLDAEYERGYEQAKEDAYISW